MFASNDLTKITAATRTILTNREVIAIDQDCAGIQGHRVWQEGSLEIWMNPLADGSKAVGMFNRESGHMTRTLKLKEIGVTGPVKLRDLWAHKNLGSFMES